MTKKIIKSSDVLGDNYYIYELSSSNFTPALNGTITITCTVTDVYGDPIGSKSITLYKNGTSVSTKTTNSSGVATWSVTCSTAGIQSFKVGNKAIEVFVDNKSDIDHTHSNYVTTSDSRLSDARTPTSHTHGNLQNNGQVGSTAQANKNVVTNSSGLITTEDKPTIPSASSTTPSADTQSGSVGTGTTWARSNHTHPKSSLYAEATHNHTKSQITDFPSIPSKTSDLQNDSGFLTSHQDISGKLDKAQTSYKGKNVVVDSSSGNITFEDKNNHTHSNYLTSTDISGKIDSAGTGLSKSGTTLNHSNSITALTTASFKKVKYDSQGHITGTSNVSASDLPSHTHTQSQITDFPTLGNLAYEDNVENYVGDVALSNDYNDLDNLPQLSAVALSNDYDDLDNTPTIPTVNNLDSGFTTSTMQTTNVITPTGSSDLMQYHFNQSVNEDIGDLWTSIQNKANSTHTHTKSQITDFPTIPDVSGKEDKSNKVTSLSSASTDTQYPSAKAVYDELADKADKTSVVDWDNIVFVDKTDDATGSIILNFLS